MTTDSNKYNLPLIRFDQTSKKLIHPTLLLKTRTGEFIGKIPYTDLKFSFVGAGLDELSFQIHKYTDGKECAFWDKLIDLAIVDYVGYGQFEATFDTNDADETIKTCTAVSLETELGQRILYEFHVNDDDAYLNSNDYSPTVLYNKDDKEHSLLHRVIADKASHWKIGNVPELLNVGGEVCQPSTLQRAYTVDGTSIYDFLMGEVAEESGCIFTFDTYNRIINCYNLKECVYNKDTGEIVDNVDCLNGIYYYKDGTLVDASDSNNYRYCEGIGNDTNVFVTKNKLAKELQLQSDKDGIKNCFRVTGGDDIINNWVGVATGTGENYIYMFDNFQFHDMPKELSKTIQEYNTFFDSEIENYNGDDGLFIKYCEALETYYYLKDNKFPDTTPESTTAENQLNNITTHFQSNNVIVRDAYDMDSFAGITKTVESMINVLCDSRYTVKLQSGRENGLSYPRISNSINDTTTTCEWTGRITIICDTDEKDSCSSGDFIVNITKIPRDNYETNDAWCKQRLEIAIAKMSIADLKLSNYSTEDELKNFFDEYNQESLKSFYEALKSCVEQLDSLYSNDITSDTYKSIREIYQMRCNACKVIYEKRQDEVSEALSNVEKIQNQISAFHEKINMKSYFLKKPHGDILWKQFQCYIREDEYNNPNYISDGLTDDKLLDKVKELVNVAKEELKNACIPQYTISGNLNDLFALDELSVLYNKFNIFNYIRCQLDDRIYKLRIIQIDFDENSPEDLQVTFSEQIENISGYIDDTKNILSQAASIATSYSSTTKQAKQGSDALSTFVNLKNEGLSTSAIIINDDDNEVTWDRTGILCRRMSDIGEYGDDQLRITKNAIVFTDSAWTNLPKMAIGYTKLGDEWLYGVVCDALVGNLIAGEKLTISNNKRTVSINQNGITINSNGIKDDDIVKDDEVFSIYNDAGEKTLWLDENGNAKFNGTVIAKNSELEGKIVAKNGQIGNWHINDYGIYTGDTETTSANMMYIYSNSNGIGIKCASRRDLEGNYKKIELTSGKITFSDNETPMSTLSSSSWTGNYSGSNNKGTTLLSEKKSKFIAFGNQDDNDNDSEAYTASFLLNYGLDPNGYTEDVIIYGTSRFIGAIYFSDDSYIASSSKGGIFCSSDLYVYGDTSLGHVNATGVSINGAEAATQNWVANDFISSVTTKDIQALPGSAGCIRFSNSDVGDQHIAASKYWIERWYPTREEVGNMIKNVGSDHRIKKNISQLSNVKDFYLDLKPKQYQFKESDSFYDSELYYTGIIAQELQSNLEKHNLNTDCNSLVRKLELPENSPNCIYSDNNEILGVNYNNLHAYHIAFGQEIYKELTDEIASLKQENTETKQELSSLRQEIEELKKLIKQSQEQD